MIESSNRSIYFVGMLFNDQTPTLHKFKYIVILYSQIVCFTNYHVCLWFVINTSICKDCVLLFQGCRYIISGHHTSEFSNNFPQIFLFILFSCLLDDRDGGWWTWSGGVSSCLLVFEMNDIIGIRSIHWAGEMLQREAGKQ